MVREHYLFERKDADTGSLKIRFKTETESYVAAHFAAGKWVSCILAQPEATPVTSTAQLDPKTQSPFKTPGTNSHTSRRRPNREDDYIPF